jgi:hyperosmotically inducible protein
MFERIQRIAIAALALLAVPAFAAPPITYDEPAGPSRDQGSTYGIAQPMSDGWITTKVKFQLIRKPGIAPLAINVDTTNGIVTLFGTVTTEDGKRDAGLQAMQVAGVKDVRNELQVVPKTIEKTVAKSDDRIRDTVEKRLDQRPALKHDGIDVEVANGVVRLSGNVDQSGDRMIALSLARSTEGVRSVVDGLRVAG